MKINVPNINNFFENYDKTIEEFENFKEFIKDYTKENDLTDENIQKLETINNSLKESCVFLESFKKDNDLIEFDENSDNFYELFNRLNIEKENIVEINENLEKLSDFNIKNYIKELNEEKIRKIEENTTIEETNRKSVKMEISKVYEDDLEDLEK